MPTAASPTPHPPIYLTADYDDPAPDLLSYGFANAYDDPAFLVTNGIIFDGVTVSPTNAYAWAEDAYVNQGFTPELLMFSHEQEPCFSSWTALQNPDTRAECLNRLAATFAEVRRAFGNNCQFLLEPYPLGGIYALKNGSSLADASTEDAIANYQAINDLLRTPVSGFPNGFFSLFSGLAINLYRRKYLGADQQQYMENQVAVSRLSGLPLHMYLSPREAFSVSFAAPSGYSGTITTSATQRILDVEKFAADLDFALRHGTTVTIWDSFFYGASTASYATAVPTGGTGILNSLAGNWGSGGVTAAAYVGQSGMSAGYGPSANRATWSQMTALPWWSHLLSTLLARGYYTNP